MLYGSIPIVWQCQALSTVDEVSEALVAHTSHHLCPPSPHPTPCPQVCGDILWCLATTLNCHIRWLLSTCPDLLRCPSWVLVHHQGPEWLQRCVCCFAAPRCCVCCAAILLLPGVVACV